MSVILCEVCKTEPKKYKCPTCSIPYCSLACFKTHKPSHETAEPAASTLSQTAAASSETPPPPAPTSRPRPGGSAPDFSLLTSNPKFQALLSTHPSLLLSLQRVYAATLEPDFDSSSRGGGGRGNYRGRGDRGRWRGRGGFGGDSSRPRWTEEKGDTRAMKLLARFREGDEGTEEEVAMTEFVDLIQELFNAEARGDPAAALDDGAMETG